jgi:PAS domain S-box-containing protein
VGEGVQTLFERTLVPSWVCVADTLAIVAANRAASEKLGWPRADLLASTMADLFVAGSMPCADGVVSWELRTKNGEVIDVEASVTGASHDGRDAWIVQATRVEPRRDAKGGGSVIDTRRQCEWLLSATSAVLYACAAAPPYDTKFVTENVTKLLGHSVDTILGTPSFWLDNVHPDDRERVAAEVVAVFTKGRHVSEYRFRRADGTYVWLHDEVVLACEDGEVTGLIGCALDVTARREMECALRRSEANFRALIEGVPLGVFVHREGRIVYANPSLATMLRKTREELLGSSTLSVVPASTRDLVRARVEILEAQPIGARNPRWESELLRGDGTHVTVEVEAMKLDFDGRPSIVVVAHDITDRASVLSRLAASDRLASLGTLAAGVAHEINNPLAFVQMNLALLSEHAASLEPPGARRSGLSRDEIAEILRDAREGADRIQALVRDLRTFARPDPEQVGAVDLREVIDSCVRMAQNHLLVRAKLVLSLGDVPRIAGSATRLAQVFLNLLINAAHSIPEGDPTNNEVRVVSYRAASGDVVVEITDTGAGIAPEVLGRVFDPFFTTKAVGVGTGLGLAICHGIVKSMGGEISVETQLGKGSTFRVVLPEWRGAAVRETVEDADASRERSRRTRILIVDDERAMGESLRLLLGMDHDVTVSTSARAALDRIRDGFSCDLVLCDLMMPDVTGVEFYDQLGRIAPSLVPRVIFLTGGAFTPSTRQFLERVPNPRLEKPVDLDALDEAIRSVWKRADALES